MLDFGFFPPLAATRAKYLGLGADIRSFKEPLSRAVRQVMIPSIRENFDAAGRPGWEPLSEFAQNRHAAEGGSGSPLNKSGELRKKATQLKIWTFTRETAQTNAPTWYANMQQSGFAVGGPRAATIPARPFMVIQPEDVPKVNEIFQNWLSERLAARF